MSSDFKVSLHPQQLDVYKDPHRFKIVVAGRRWGKSRLALYELFIEALKSDTADVYYVAPTFEQGKRIMWRIMKEIGKDLIEWAHENTATIRLINGRQIFICGSDRPDTLRGVPMAYCVLDEYASMKPLVWEEIVRPALMDVKGSALFIGCVAQDTMILGEHGIEEIGTCPIGYSDEDKKVYGKGGFHQVTHRFGNKELPTKILTSRKGFALEATPNHRLWTPEGWRRMDEFKPGDALWIQHNQQVYGTVHLDKDYAYFLGLYLAEGNSERKIYRVTISSGDDEIHDRLAKMGFRRYGEFHSRKNSKEFLSRLIEWFPDAGATRAPRKYLPPKILELDRESISAFLSGYFDGDGSAHSGKQVVSCSSSSYKLSKQIQVLMLNMGMFGRMTRRITKPTKRVARECIAWALEFEGRSAWRFANEIGFGLKRKQDLTLEWTASNGHEIWFDREDFGRLTGTDGYLSRVSKVRQKTLDDVLRKNPNTKYDIQLLADEVVSVVDSSRETFDFCIPETHSYFTNGFVSHNTPAGKNHFYDLYMAGLNKPEWACFQYKSLDNPFLDPKEIAVAFDSLSSQIARQELEASFESFSSGLFMEDWIKYGEEPEEGEWYVVADLAGFEETSKVRGKSGGKLDEAAIWAVKVHTKGWFLGELEHGRWNIRETSVRLLRLAQEKHARCIAIEKGALLNAVFPYMEDQMRRIGYYPRIETVTHGGKNKTDRIVWALQGRFERGVITLKEAPWNRAFITQLLDFPNPLAHDDLVDGLSYVDQVAVTPYAQDIEEDEWEPFDLVSGY